MVRRGRESQLKERVRDDIYMTDRPSFQRQLQLRSLCDFSQRGQNLAR